MFVIRGVVRRNRNGETGMITALFTDRKGLALHHRHLMLVVMNSVMHDIVDPGFGA